MHRVGFVFGKRRQKNFRVISCALHWEISAFYLKHVPN